MGQHIFVALIVAASLLAGLRVSDARAEELSVKKAAQLAGEYLDSDDEDQREKIAERLAGYAGDIDEVLARLRARDYDDVEPGYHPAEHFTHPDLADDYEDDRLYFTIPRDYKPSEPAGLIIFMHGGGRHSLRTWPKYFMNFPDEDNDDSSQLGDIFAETGMIAVGPSAPWDEETAYRWCVRESDDYLAAVVRECSYRFNIDPHRVFLVGHSMGGFGAYHHILRQPDRFAAVVVNAGSWSLGYWPVIRGTKLCIIQGAEDAEKGERWHWTDIAYARTTDKILDRLELDYVYYEHKHGHWVGYGRPYMRKFFAANADLRRDPYYPHVTLASPVGFMRSYCSSVDHNRWLTLNESTDGDLKYDYLWADNDVDFDDWELHRTTHKRPGAMIDAVNHGDNKIEITTKNVARLTVWLHPRMIDADEPVRITVDGRTLFKGDVEPNLLTALESYERRHDWGLIYPIKVEIAVPDDDE